MASTRTIRKYLTVAALLTIFVVSGIWSGADTIRLPAGSDLATAVAVARAGDVLELEDGHYMGGFRIRRERITLRAVSVRRAIIDGTGFQDAVQVYAANGVRLEGIVFEKAQRAGVWVADSADVTVQKCTARDNGVWGVFTSFSPRVAILETLTTRNRLEHGIYVSNSADGPQIMRNMSWNNGKAGIQINGDGKMKRPSLGKDGDGIIEGAVVEHNACWGNKGQGGNFLCVRGSRFSLNRFKDNGTVGMAFSNDNRPDRLDLGSSGNLVNDNVLSGNAGHCVVLKNGSVDNVFNRNTLTGPKACFEVNGSALRQVFGSGARANVLKPGWKDVLNESTGKRYSLAEFVAFVAAQESAQ